MLIQVRVGNVAEQGRGATKRASDALILVRTGEEPERTLHAQATPFPGGPGRRRDGHHGIIDLPGSAPPK